MPDPVTVTTGAVVGVIAIGSLAIWGIKSIFSPSKEENIRCLISFFNDMEFANFNLLLRNFKNNGNKKVSDLKELFRNHTKKDGNKFSEKEVERIMELFESVELKDRQSAIEFLEAYKSNKNDLKTLFRRIQLSQFESLINKFESDKSDNEMKNNFKELNIYEDSELSRIIELKQCLNLTTQDIKELLEVEKNAKERQEQERQRQERLENDRQRRQSEQRLKELLKRMRIYHFNNCLRYLEGKDFSFDCFISHLSDYGIFTDEDLDEIESKLQQLNLREQQILLDFLTLTREEKRNELGDHSDDDFGDSSEPEISVPKNFLSRMFMRIK